MSNAELIRIGAVVFLAMTFVVLGDTAGKALANMGVSPLVVAWTRLAIAAVVIVPLARVRQAEWPAMLSWRVLLRAAFIAGGLSSILTSLKTVPIADAFGAFFIGPIVSYVLAVFFLGERPSRGRTVLLVIGFMGVMMVVRPGFGATPGIFFAVLAGCFYGAYLMMTRLLAGQHRAMFLLASQLLVGAILLAPLGLSVPWPSLTVPVSLLLVASAFCSAAGNLLLVIISRRAEASLVAPLVYTQLIAAMIAGALAFGDWPDAWSQAGLVLILCSGFGALWLTRRR